MDRLVLEQKDHAVMIVDPRYIGSPKRISDVSKWIRNLEVILRDKEDGLQRRILEERIIYWKAYLNLIKTSENPWI